MNTFKYLMSIALLFALTSAFSQENTPDADSLVEIEITATSTDLSKTENIIDDSSINQRQVVFEDRHSQLKDDLKNFSKFLKKTNQHCLTSTGYLKPSVTTKYKQVQDGVKDFCNDVKTEISQVKYNCKCVSENKSLYINRLEELRSEVQEQTQKINNTIAKLLKRV